MLQLPVSNPWTISTGIRPHGKTGTESCSLTFVMSWLVINMLYSSQGNFPCRFSWEVESHQKSASSPRMHLIPQESWVTAGEGWMPCDYLAIHAHPMISEDLGSAGLSLKCNDPPGFKYNCSVLNSTVGTKPWMPGTQGSVLHSPAVSRLDWWKKRSIFPSPEDGFLQGKSQKKRTGKVGKNHSGLSLAPQK